MDRHKIKEAITVWIIFVILVLAVLTIYYSFQKDSGMATATTTMVLVIITGFVRV
jgi:hypothetical protein